MMRVLNFLRQLAIYFSYGLLCILSVITLFFSLATVIRFRQYEQNDLFDIVRDHVPLLLLSMVVILVLMRMVLKCMTRSRGRSRSKIRSKSKIRSRSEQGKSGEHPPFPWPMLLAAGGMSLFLVLVIRGNATNDALQLDEIMQAFSRGDYSSLQEGGYLFVYPFQVTYVLIGQVIQALCGPSNYLVYQLLNVVSILCNLYFLYQITWELFHDRRVCAVMQLLSMGCWFYYVFATFIYADLWSFAVQSAAFLLEIRYLNRRRLRDIIGAGICIAAATLLKTNCYVALIAMILILLMDAVKAAVSAAAGTAASGNAGGSGNTAGTAAAGNAEASGNAGALILRAVLLGVMFVVLTKGAQSAVNFGTARAAGIEKMPEGVPSAAYFAMGMEETEGKYGWYNGRNVGLFRDAGYDREQTVLDARETMKASIGEFQNSKRYLIRFYAGKFLSQWGDPTCVSMREMEETRRHTGELPKLVDSLIFGTGSRILQWGMNVTHSLIYLGLTIYLLSVTGSALRRKQKLRMPAQNGQQAQKQGQHLHTVSEPEILLVLFLVGGMLFHQIWEASGRYTMRYYLTMLPLAAWGICRLIGGKQQEA
ncbi:hypothetical protein ACTQ4Q_00675 [Bacillota bacterium LCP21S3_D9]|nr:hypothetical protein [Bacillota bacterium]